MPANGRWDLIRRLKVKMEEHLLTLENPLLKILLEDERSVRLNPIFDEREKCGELHTLFPMLLEQTLTSLHYFRMGPDTFWYILHNIRPYIEKQSNFRNCISPEERLG